MWDLIDEELAKKSGAKKGDMIKKYVNDLTALGRTSVPEDVSKVVSFLSGPDSDFMTGQTVVVSARLAIYSTLLIMFRWMVALFTHDRNCLGRMPCAMLKERRSEECQTTSHKFLSHRFHILQYYWLHKGNFGEF